MEIGSNVSCVIIAPARLGWFQNESDSIMPLNSVSVDLSDDEHTQMDGLVLSSHPPVYPPMLLMLVVSESDGLLDQRYCDVIEAKNLLAKYPELGERLMTAHSARSFKDIRTLGMLFISENPGNVKACRVLFRNTSTAKAKKTFPTTSNSKWVTALWTHSALSHNAII